jgi:2-methylcitrate dehydratase PrpD
MAQTEPISAEVTEWVDALARFCQELHFEMLPAPIVLEAKNRLLDFVGCTLAGVREASSQMVRRVLWEWGGQTEAAVIGTDRRLPAALAAFCNGAAGHAVEMDDDHKQAILHPGVCVIPAALATAEKAGASGRQLLAAIVAGYEIMCRIGEAALPHRLLAKGFHPTGVCGAFGAAAAAAHVQSLSLEQFQMALGIAGSFAAGLFEFVNDGSLVKRLHPGNAAKSGVLAAQLAAQGYSGPRQVLQGRLGFFNAFAGGCSPAPLTRDLGQAFEIARTSYKQYACCSYCHPLMDALLELLEMTPLDPAQVQEVVGRTFTDAIRIVGEPQAQKQEPANPVDAQFSAHYSLAVAFWDRRAMPEQFSWDRVQDPQVRWLARRIRLEAEPAFDREFPRRYPAEVMVRLQDGRCLNHRVSTSKGDPAWPLTQGEVEGKFFALAGGVLPPDRAEAIRDAIGGLEASPDIRALAALLAA